MDISQNLIVFTKTWKINFSLAKWSLWRSNSNVMKKLLLFVLSLTSAFYCGCQTPTDLGKKQQTVYPKRNLEILLSGKNQIEVIEILGHPDAVAEDSSGRIVTWEYRREVLDQATGLIFYLSRIWLTFEKGVCVEVQVELL